MGMHCHFYRVPPEHLHVDIPWNENDIDPLLDILDKVIAFYHNAAEAGDAIILTVV